MCGPHANDMDNVRLCRQCAETELWIIEYTRSVRDDKQMMCTCVDNMQMTWTMCICVDNVQKLYIIEYIKSTRDDVWMTLVLSVRKEDIKDHFR